ncbi:STAS domain-containing protein [Actinoplanes sp. NPDC051494]|uniref:STAS domain-containing protein n=1 Tax=Actinoplanes sp. NPDC051494 TaxID=3363907 RepID=UPI00378F1C4E
MKPESPSGFDIVVLADPGAPSALVCLSGEIDLAASVMLSSVAAHLSAIAPTTVVIDLAGVTFACSALPNFLARLRASLPAGSTMHLCRPTHPIHVVLRVTDMGQIATLRADLPFTTPACPCSPGSGAGR